MRRLSVLMATAFVDMLGFAMIFPLLPFYALRLEAAEWVIGWMIASFSIVQLARSCSALAFRKGVEQGVGTVLHGLAQLGQRLAIHLVLGQ